MLNRRAVLVAMHNSDVMWCSEYGVVHYGVVVHYSDVINYTKMVYYGNLMYLQGCNAAHYSVVSITVMQ